MDHYCRRKLKHLYKQVPKLSGKILLSNKSYLVQELTAVNQDTYILLQTIMLSDSCRDVKLEGEIPTWGTALVIVEFSV